MIEDGTINESQTRKFGVSRKKSLMVPQAAFYFFGTFKTIEF